MTLTNISSAPATTLGTITLGANGSGTFSTTSLAIGTYSVIASYSGDSNYEVSASSAMPLTITTPAKVSVPNVVGLTQSAATTSITGAGLVVGTVSMASSSTVASGSRDQRGSAGGNVGDGRFVCEPRDLHRSGAYCNFTISVIPPTETIDRGVLGGFILELNSVKGFNENVKLSCSGGPAGSECADLPQTVKVDGTAFALSGILFPKNATPGTYTITFTGISGSLTNTATAKFTVK